MFGIPITLHQTESFDIFIFKRADAHLQVIIQRPPQPFVITVVYQQAVAVMNLHPVIKKTVFGIFAKQIHTGQRCYADLFYRRPRKQNRFNIHPGCIARLNDKVISSGNSRRIKQSIKFNLFVAGFGLLQPKGRKLGKFLTGNQPGIHGQAARRSAVFLMFAETAEVAGAQKNHKLVKVVRRIQRIMQPEAGIPQVFKRVQSLIT